MISYLNRRVAFSALCLSIVASASAPAGSRVTVDGSPDAGFRLLFNGKPYFIRGAGGQKHLEDLVTAGGNSIRTWGIESLDEHTDGGKRLIDRVADLGLTVTAGIWVGQRCYDGYRFPTADFLDFLAARNKRLAEFYRPAFAALPTTTDLTEFQAYADNLGDPQLARLAGESCR